MSIFGNIDICTGCNKTKKEHDASGTYHQYTPLKIRALDNIYEPIPKKSTQITPKIYNSITNDVCRLCGIHKSIHAAVNHIFYSSINKKYDENNIKYNIKYNYDKLFNTSSPHFIQNNTPHIYHSPPIHPITHTNCIIL